ncbi:CheR family methyltransferase [Gluconobacter kanchanaburiensis]|uniref:Chemotaxis protein methyltransferase n=1 Tax=Gluconobacter kanchanaburiensis NBRC 103587 TaxID=1307948 RepID=A0A511B8K4_9PROT|nr:protein-glutamate O-methyltransferase CheR [Gluconobacter kanchanaburiensis]MBF0861053.1 protein-glutamate O-methyltransferase CheR [Gluconobacter kanchanaburiensis]GBR70293.1 chemotaxis protein CheR [Gluconobacter kanchanaburiensis NBRC 103587]GEK96749.1 chemotaxis protein methyltransferase [Gluconobacter kanchanaburiensis NBRC 103587]
MTENDFDYENNISDRNFEIISRIAKDCSGISLSLTKKNLVYSRISRRVRREGFGSIDDYCDFISGIDGVIERQYLVSALTTNVTSFFRERHHFVYLEHLLRQRLYNRLARGEELRIWSAACSSGEEAYSIAMTVMKCLSAITELKVKILATDIDADILLRAKAGYYDASEAGNVLEDGGQRFFHQDGDRISMSQTLRDIIRFRRLNLVEPWPFSSRFHAVFCRNVAIYFDRETQDLLWKNLSKRIFPGGELYLGHSERIAHPERYGLEGIGPNAYCKVALTESRS